MVSDPGDRRPTRAFSLSEMQRQHATFEADRGLDFPHAELGEDAATRRLAMIEYAALAVAGEAGELANSVKKARRAAWTGGSSEEHLVSAAEELADTLAYLFKLANALGQDLAENYLEKMIRNALRFPGQPGPSATGALITIAGPPGSGKTTVTRMLRNKLPVYVEEAQGNAYLSKFWDDREHFDARASQSWFLDHIASFLDRHDAVACLALDQDPSAIVLIYGRMLRDKGLLTRDDHVELLQSELLLESLLARWPRRVVIVLDADVGVLERRLAEDGREPLPASWLERQRREFAELAATAPYGRVVSTVDHPPEDIANEILDLVHPWQGATLASRAGA